MNKSLRKNIADNLRMYRAKKRLSQEGLADIANISFQYVCSIENEKNNPTVEVLFRIAEALDVTLNDLVY